MHHLSPHTIFAISLTPVDDVVVSLRLGTSKAKAFFFGLSANSEYLSVRSLRLWDPVFAPVVDDVLYRAHLA